VLLKTAKKAAARKALEAAWHNVAPKRLTQRLTQQPRTPKR
jgi:hypothetical protein